VRKTIKDIDLDAIFEARGLLTHTKYKVRYVDESILGYAGIAQDSTGGWVLEEDGEWIRDLAIVSGHRCEVRDAVAASLDVEACDVDLFPTEGIVHGPTDPHQDYARVWTGTSQSPVHRGPPLPSASPTTSGRQSRPQQNSVQRRCPK
jgi:hypothetical protein